MKRPRGNCPSCGRGVALLPRDGLPAMHRCLNGYPWPVRGQLADLRAACEAWQEHVIDKEMAVVRCETVVARIGKLDARGNNRWGQVAEYALQQARNSAARAGETRDELHALLITLELGLPR